MRGGAALVWSLTALAVALVNAPRPVLAQLEFAEDKPRIFAVQERPYHLRHEFHLGVGALPLDAFYVGAVVEAGYTYHFSDVWAWEIGAAGYSFNIESSLEDDLKQRYRLRPVQVDVGRIERLATSQAVLKPLFGEVSLFNRTIVFVETYFKLGAGALGRRDAWAWALDAGVGLRLWSSQLLSWRLEARDYVSFGAGGTANTLLLGISAAFNFDMDAGAEP